MAHGPSLDSVVSPAPELLVSSKGDEPAAYIGMKYKEYLKLQQSNKLDGKSCLDRIDINSQKIETHMQKRKECEVAYLLNQNDFRNQENSNKT
ncbi:hypothetical protein SADUNF_Sadunf17G0044900 [Salix dunnii]|uniref:Uncharacterized protein n=1 Tax=Salix dunnii TaxID=1413687 RepID=A0A835J4X7_9ROSI|nr:hypothetical protein SADUNF_Sadunf17G0044900 [Salix dunnii]